MSHVSNDLKRIIEEFTKPEDLVEIWEIGSRDGEDGRELLKSFPASKVIAFEPNPDTFEKVRKVSSESDGKIKALNIAISDTDGQITFFKIDTGATITTWEDGNPGASSLFAANNKYDVERYVQIPIKVTSRRAASLIELDNCKVPDLIWMDVQGAEDLVLKSFDNYLANVGFVYVELSLKPLYEGQPLAKDVIQRMSKDFYWHSNLTLGEWQFDGLFINKKYGNPSLKIRNRLLTLSLALRLHIGISYTLTYLTKSQARKIVKNLFHIVVKQFRANESRFFGWLIVKSSIKIAKLLRMGSLPFRLRQLVSLAQPTDPLSPTNLPEIEILIPCQIKDINNLGLVIQGARKNVRNPIRGICLITPANSVDELAEKFPEITVISDEDTLGAEFVDLINRLVPESRRGWVVQQAIKILKSIKSDVIATLVLDADTILLHPKTWIDSSGKQILCLAEEYHQPYKEHGRRYLGVQSFPLSFVTHHQLMKRDVLREIFGHNGEFLQEWLIGADFSQSSAISEYDTYGEYLIANKANQIEFSKWNNLATKLVPESGDFDFSTLERKFSSYASISNHSYLS